MKEVTRKAIIIGFIAGGLVLIDGFISKLLNQSASFTWVAFVSWTVFFGATTKERLKAILGYVIGFFAALAIINFGSLLSFMNVLGIAFGSIVATIIGNFLCMEMELLDKKFPISINGIFVGMGMTFSGLGIGLSANTLNNATLMLGIIIIYGILGLLSGWASIKFGNKE